MGLFDRHRPAEVRAATKERFAFTAAIDPVALTARILDAVRPEPDLRRLGARVVVLDADANAVTFGYGTRSRISWRSRLTVAATDDGGARAQYLVLKWWEDDDGVVAGTTEMQRLANAIRDVAAELGATLGPVDSAAGIASRIRPVAAPLAPGLEARRQPATHLASADAPLATGREARHAPATHVTPADTPDAPIAPLRVSAAPLAPQVMPSRAVRMPTVHACASCGAATDGRSACANCGARLR